MATTATILIEIGPGEYEAARKVVDGYPETVVPELRNWLNSDRPDDFVGFVEDQRRKMYPQKMWVPGTGEVTVDYRQVYWRGGWEGHSDFVYSILLNGRMFEGREI